MLDKVAVGLDTRWVNQGVTRMGNSTASVGSWWWAGHRRSSDTDRKRTVTMG